MKNLNRWVYAIIGVITLLLAGLVYAWSVMSKSIGAARPDWTAAQLSIESFLGCLWVICL